ncbi:MAG: hypothetical protein V1861_05150 [Candidatus Micrarchaeota archaeon]
MNDEIDSDADEDVDAGKEAGRRFPGPPLLEKLPSKTCRKMLVKIRRKDAERDKLARMAKNCAFRGKLQSGELRSLLREIEAVFSPNAGREPQPADPVICEGIRGASNESKPQAYARRHWAKQRQCRDETPKICRIPLEPKTHSTEVFRIAIMPAVPNTGSIFGSRPEIQRLRRR